jgi:hypothetical protein
MAGRDRIVMSLGEVKRLKLIHSAIDRQITQKSVSTILGLSERQVRRLVKVYQRGFLSFLMVNEGLEGIYLLLLRSLKCYATKTFSACKRRCLKISMLVSRFQDYSAMGIGITPAMRIAARARINKESK